MSNHYIDNNKFLEILTKYLKDVKKSKREKTEKPPIPNYIGECFMKIAENLARKPNFMNYSYREEMIGDAIENCLMYFENFDPNKTKNPFAYFTQIVFYAFLRRIAKENKNQYTKYKVLQHEVLFNNDFVVEEENGLKSFEIYDNIAEFTSNFEEKQKKKQAAKPQTATKASKKPKKKKGLEKFLT